MFNYQDNVLTRDVAIVWLLDQNQNTKACQQSNNFYQQCSLDINVKK